MRIDDQLEVIQVADEHILFMPASGTVSMNRVIALNPSALLLFQRLKGRDFVVEDVVGLLLDEYAVDEGTALRDANQWIQEMEKQGILLRGNN